MMRRRGATLSEKSSSSKRQRNASEDNDEGNEGNDRNGANCPICFEAFAQRGTGARTVVYAFGCGGGVRHGICRSCDRRMFNAHGDACPICRAPRLGTSITQLGFRPPQERNGDSVVVPFLSSAGATIFFPVDTDEAAVPVLEIRSASTDAAADASTVINDIMNDAVLQVAIEGLRNPGTISMQSFLSNLAAARSRQPARWGSRWHSQQQ